MEIYVRAEPSAQYLQKLNARLKGVSKSERAKLWRAVVPGAMKSIFNPVPRRGMLGHRFFNWRTSPVRPVRADRLQNNYAKYLLCGAILCGFSGRAVLYAQAAPGAPSPSSSSSVVALPLSGRGISNGSVTATQSVPNASGTGSVNVINSTVTLTGPYAGSVPNSNPVDTTSPLTLETALKLGLRNNLGKVSQSNNVLQAAGQRVVARSALLPQVSSRLGETLEKVSLAAQGLKTSSVPIPGLPSTIGPFNFFDARAVRLNQTLFDLVQLGNLRSATHNLAASRASAMDARDIVVLAVVGTYLQVTSAQARAVATGAQVEVSKSIYQQAAVRFAAGTNARIDVTRSQVEYQTDIQRLRAAPDPRFPPLGGCQKPAPPCLQRCAPLAARHQAHQYVRALRIHHPRHGRARRAAAAARSMRDRHRRPLTQILM